MKTKSIDRARYLMSPYNLREARRAKEIKNTLIGISLTILIGVIIASVYACLRG